MCDQFSTTQITVMSKTSTCGTKLRTPLCKDLLILNDSIRLVEALSPPKKIIIKEHSRKLSLEREPIAVHGHKFVLSGLSHSRHYLPGSTLATLVHTGIDCVNHSVRHQCLRCMWCHSDRLQRMLNFGARVISGRRKYDHISDVMRDLQWLSAENMWRFHSVMLLKKMFTTGQPESLHDRIASRGSVHGRSTRQAGQLDTPMIRTETGRRRFLYSAVTMYNELPTALRDLSLRRFKSEYRALLLRKRYGND